MDVSALPPREARRLQQQRHNVGEAQRSSAIDWVSALRALHWCRRHRTGWDLVNQWVGLNRINAYTCLRYTLRFMSIFELENDDETVDGMLLDNPLWTGPKIMWPHVLVQLDWSLGLALNDAELDPQMSELVLQHPKREGCFHCLMLCHRMPQAKKCRWVRVRLLETRRNNGPC